MFGELLRTAALEDLDGDTGELIDQLVGFTGGDHGAHIDFLVIDRRINRAGLVKRLEDIVELRREFSAEILFCYVGYSTDPGSVIHDEVVDLKHANPSFFCLPVI